MYGMPRLNILAMFVKRLEYTIIRIDLGNESLHNQKSLVTMYIDYSLLTGQLSLLQILMLYEMEGTFTTSVYICRNSPFMKLARNNVFPESCC